MKFTNSIGLALKCFLQDGPDGAVAVLAPRSGLLWKIVRKREAARADLDARGSRAACAMVARSEQQGECCVELGQSQNDRHHRMCGNID